MAWEFTDDVTVYLERVWPLLAAHPVDNTLALTVVEAARAGQRWSNEPMVFGCYQQGPQVSGAVLHTPPYELVLAVVPNGAVDDLVSTLHARQAWVPGVYGDPDLVECFAKRWIASTSWRAVVTMHQRLYALGALHPPAPLAAGGAHRAGREDFDLVLGWFVEFTRDIGARAAGLEHTVGRRIDHGLVWLWHNRTGVIVSLAGRNPTLAGVARLGPVYTPPQHRQRGYGAAVTAACTRDALRGGAHHVVLFTDLANPTSNALYQRLGYRPVSDRTITTFTSSRPPATCWVMRGACVVPECDSQPITPYGPGPEREPSVSHAAHTPYPRPGRRDVPALRLTNITCHQSRLLTSS